MSKRIRKGYRLQSSRSHDLLRDSSCVFLMTGPLNRLRSKCRLFYLYVVSDSTLRMLYIKDGGDVEDKFRDRVVAAKAE